MVFEVEVKALSELSSEDRSQIKNLATELRAHPFQTFEWMEACKYESVIEPHIVMLKKKDEIVSYWFYYFRDSEINFMELNIKIRNSVTRAGPVVANPKCYTYIGDMAEAMREHARSHGAKFIEILTETIWRDELGKYITPKGFIEKTFCTYLVDLSPPLELIWNKTDTKSARWAIRTAQKKNVKCVEGDSKDDFECYQNLYIETWRRSGKNVKVENFWERYKPLIEKDMCKLFLAIYNNRRVAGLLLVYNNEIGIYYSGASSEEGFKCCANDLLQWNAITFLKNRGVKYYDLLGVECDPKKGTKGYNLRQFKGKWGGSLVHTPRYVWFSAEMKIVKKLRDLLAIFPGRGII
jgi:hypothetical protein